MDTVADLARAFLAVIFTVAAVAKLLDLSASIRTMAGFGVPARYAGIGKALPFAELATALALVFEPTARWGAIAALVLLLIFIAGIANSLSHGRTPDCNCFGQVASEPISSGTIARNVVLAAIAVPVVINGSGFSLFAWTGSRTGAGNAAIVLGLATVAAVVVLLHYKRQSVTLRKNVTTLRSQVGLLPRDIPIGVRAPQFALPDADGAMVTLESLCARGRPVVLFFVGPNCGSCVEMFPDLARWNVALSDRVTFAVISNGGLPHEQIAEHLSPLQGVTRLIQEGQEVADSYRILVTPTALVIGPRGTVASVPASGASEIEALVRLVLDGEFDPGTPDGDLVAQAVA
jgi:peroxiredoxin